MRIKDIAILVCMGGLVIACTAVTVPDAIFDQQQQNHKSELTVTHGGYVEYLQFVANNQ